MESREPDNDAPATAPRHRRLALWVAVLALGAVSVGFLFRDQLFESRERAAPAGRHQAKESDPAAPAALEGQLDKAHDLLAGLPQMQQPAERIEHAAEAQSLLDQYLATGGQRRSAAKLLLGAARGVQGDPRAGELLRELDLADIPAKFLNTTASLLVALGQFGPADDLVQAALATKQDREQTLRMAVLVRYDVGRYDDALEHAQELIRLAPQDARPWVVVAMIHEDRGNSQGLVEVYKKLLELQPNVAPALRPKLIEHLITVGGIREARAEFDQLQADDPRLAASYLPLQARLTHAEGKIEEALRLADQVLAKAPNNGLALLVKGRILAARAEAGLAIEVLEALVKADAKSHEGHYLLGRAYARAGDKQRAAQHLELHRQLLALKKNINALERHAGSDPTNVDVRLELVKLYEKIGMTDLADFWQQSIETIRKQEAARPKN